MFILISYLIFIKILGVWGSNAGTAIFYNRVARTECWNEEDIAKLRARRLFEQLVPSPVTPERINSRYIRDILRYFREALNSVEKYEDRRTSMMLKDALADTIGAHMRSEVLPTARFAYYAGYVPYARVRELHDFYDYLKAILNTQGVGWKSPSRVPDWSNLTVSKILIGNGKYIDPCRSLVMTRDLNSCMHIPTPVLDDTHEASAIFLPIKAHGLVSLTSPVSENVLLKYYTTTSRCILNGSPAACRHGDFVNFNNVMWHWMKRNVAPHLSDEKLYAAYGGVLRIAAAVQSYGKGLTRNFRRQDFGVKRKWRPWRTDKDNYICSSNDWTPYVYVGMVIIAALSICLIQICFNFVTGDEEGCSCVDVPKGTPTKDVAYAIVESTIPAMLPTHHKLFHTEKHNISHSSSKQNAVSAGSLRTQKVYDMNENSEKLMIVMSEEEGSSGAGSSSTGNSSTAEENDKKNLAAASPTKRPTSPPKIDTVVSQVQLTKGTNNLKRLKMLSTPTATHSEVTDQSESSCSSVSSATSKSRCLKSKRCRNLEWARRVVSEHNLLRKSTSETEADCTSLTTPTFQGQRTDSFGYYF